MKARRGGRGKDVKSVINSCEGRRSIWILMEREGR